MEMEKLSQKYFSFINYWRDTYYVTNTMLGSDTLWVLRSLKFI